MYILYIDKCRYEIQEQKEVPIWYTGTHRPVSSTSAVVPGAFTVVQRFSDCGPPGAQLFL
jgi:hypothetical protein